MSLQDDYFDLSAHLKGQEERHALERIWTAFCEMETKELISSGDMSFASWYEILMAIAQENGESVADTDAWLEEFHAGRTPASAFYSEYPELHQPNRQKS